MHILIVEDDEVARDYLARALREAGHTVDVAGNGLEGLHMASAVAVDLAIVDRMLPKLDGLALVQSLRATGRKMPVLILSALGDVDDRITGLRAGGDDYLTKPFASDEMSARLEVLLRRRQSPALVVKLRVADLDMDLVERCVRRNGQVLDLKATEFRLLEFMMRNPHAVLRREVIINAVWGYERTVENNTLDAFMKQLRSKVDSGFENRLIHTVRGFGYKLTPEREQ